MKESGVVCKKKKVYLLSLLLFLISYLTTVVNMIVNIITGSFHLYIFSTLGFMLPCYKSIKTTDVFGIVLTILLFLISFLLIFFTVKYDVLKYDQSKRPLCYTSLLLWFFITQILSSWILVYLFVCRRISWKWRVTVHILNNYFWNISTHYRLKTNVWF